MAARAASGPFLGPRTSARALNWSLPCVHDEGEDEGYPWRGALGSLGWIVSTRTSRSIVNQSFSLCVNFLREWWQRCLSIQPSLRV